MAFINGLWNRGNRPSVGNSGEARRNEPRSIRIQKKEETYETERKRLIDYDHSSNSMSSHPAEPKKLSLIFLRFVSLLFIKLPRLYGGSVTICSLTITARAGIPLKNNKSRRQPKECLRFLNYTVGIISCIPKGEKEKLPDVTVRQGFFLCVHR